MRLHTGEYGWHATLSPVTRHPALDRDISCDCLVIGGGISGALCAYLLCEQGFSTVMVEKNEIGSGSTLANTGILQCASDKPLTSCIHTFGEEKAVRFYRMCKDALDRLKEISRNLGPGQPLTERSSLYLASTEGDARMLREEYANLRKYGFDAELWTEADIGAKFPFRRPAAIWTRGEAETNPVALIHGLLRRAKSQGLEIYEHTRVTGWDLREKEVVCFTAARRKIRARHVVFAIGYETQLLKKERGAFLTRTYAVATEPAQSFEDWHERCLIWETARPYLYMRTTPDGRILAGGLDEPMPKGGLTAGREKHKAQELLKLIHAMFPEKASLRADYSWGAVFGQTRDGLPYIGTHPDYPHCMFIEGFGGNGTVYSMLAAEIISDALTGTPRPDTELFALNRSTKPVPPS